MLTSDRREPSTHSVSLWEMIRLVNLLIVFRFLRIIPDIKVRLQIQTRRLSELDESYPNTVFTVTEKKYINAFMCDSQVRFMFVSQRRQKVSRCFLHHLLKERLISVSPSSFICFSKSEKNSIPAAKRWDASINSGFINSGTQKA